MWFDEYFGIYVLEGFKLCVVMLLGLFYGVYGVSYLVLIVWLLFECDLYEDIYVLFEYLFDDFDDIGSVVVYFIYFELVMLVEFGFGLVLENCVVIGEIIDLVYVLFKFGVVVLCGVGEFWCDWLLWLLFFLWYGEIVSDFLE